MTIKSETRRKRRTVSGQRARIRRQVISTLRAWEARS